MSHNASLMSTAEQNRATVNQQSIIQYVGC